MYCPHCKYASFDHLTRCPKCNADWTEVKQALDLDWLPEPVPDWFETLQQDANEFIFEPSPPPDGNSQANGLPNQEPIAAVTEPEGSSMPTQNHKLKKALKTQDTEDVIPDIPLATPSMPDSPSRPKQEDSDLLGEIDFDLSFDQADETPASGPDVSPAVVKPAEANEKNLSQNSNQSQATAQEKHPLSEPELSFPDLDDLFGSDDTPKPESEATPKEQASHGQTKEKKTADLEPDIQLETEDTRPSPELKQHNGQEAIPLEEDVDLESFLEEIEIELEPDDMTPTKEK